MAVSTYMAFQKSQNLGDSQNIFSCEELKEFSCEWKMKEYVGNEKTATSIRTQLELNFKIIFILLFLR